MSSRQPSASMKFAIFGAAGPLGIKLVERALLEDHEVIALARRPEALSALKARFNDPNSEEEKLKAVFCNIFSADSIAEHLTGCDAVLSTLEARPTVFSKINLLTGATPAIVEAMRRSGVKRLILCTSVCTDPNRHPNMGRFLHYVYIRGFLGRNMDDFYRAEKFLQESEECSDIDFTVVKPSGLENKPLNDGKLFVSEGQLPEGCITGYIPRENVAQFMLSCTSSDDWSRKLVAISF